MRTHCWLLAVGLTACLFGGRSTAADRALEQSFHNPPAAARPAVYWVWLNGSVSLPQLTRDLEEFKAKGISKAYIFECGARDPDKIIRAGPEFMSPESVKAIGYAVREATRLGIELGLTTSSSWNAGGSWVAPEDASMGLYQSETTVKGPGRFAGELPFPQTPKAAPKGADGLPAYHEDVAVLAVPKSAGLAIKDRGAVVNLTSSCNRGRLEWDVPAGEWVVMRFVCANTGQGLAIPSPNSEGLAIDHFSSKATRKHFRFFIEKLQGELGSLKGTGMTTLYLCSYELRGAVWTPRFLEEFKQRRGYDMTPYLPAIFGWTIGSPEATERFQYDFRRTLGDLLVDAFYRTAQEACHEEGLLLCAESGGPGPPTHNVPVDAIKALGAVDIPRGEFWTDLHLQVVKETACGSHVYGKGIVDMEAFTSWAHWQYGPGDLRPFADRAMCEGTNHFTFHMCPHNPPEAGKPGWVYHAGTHICPNLVWWPKAGPFFDYLARSCHLLQQGLFVGDVCYYYGEQGYNFVAPKHADPSLGPGYDYDVANAEVLLTRMRVDRGRLVLPDGLRYELLALPDRDDMDLAVLRKLEQLVRDGATIVGRKPSRSPGLAGYPERDGEVRSLADRLWGKCDGKQVKENPYGKGKVVWGRTLREILESRGLGPDFAVWGGDPETRIDYLHRRAGDAEIYFVSNRGPRWEHVECAFRVSGKRPELWMPDRGEIRSLPVYQPVRGGTRLPLRLPPSGAVFVVFREPADEAPIVSVRHDGVSVVQGAPGAAWVDRLPCEVRATPIGLELLAWEPGEHVLETAGPKTHQVRVASVPAAASISGPWTVRFPAGWGAPPQATFSRLMSWTTNREEGIKYFSGIATYEKRFDVPEALCAEGAVLVLDLGDVQKVADVTLNGKSLGILWKAPYRVEVTGVVRPKENHLVVEVANTWSNRLVGDATSPQGKQYCRTNMKFSHEGVLWKDTPLLESGLLGPVRLLPAKKVTIGTDAAPPAERGSSAGRKAANLDELHLFEPFWNSQTVYREGLFFIQETAEEPPAAHLLFVPTRVTSLWTDVLKRKGYYDLTGNGVNQANDYGHRLYAQAILGLLVESMGRR